MKVTVGVTINTCTSFITVLSLQKVDWLQFKPAWMELCKQGNCAAEVDWRSVVEVEESQAT